MWLADARSQLVAPLRRIQLDRESGNWPRDSEIVDLAADDGTDRSRVVAAIIAGLAELFVITEDADRYAYVAATWRNVGR